MGLPWGSKYSWVRTMVDHKLESPSLCPAPKASVAMEGWPGVSNITGKAVYSVQRHHLFCTNLSFRPALLSVQPGNGSQWDVSMVSHLLYDVSSSTLCEEMDGPDLT